MEPVVLARHAPVCAHFGSAAGELAVCVRRVGLANRSDLGKLELSGPAPALDELVRRVASVSLAPGGTGPSGGAWWCRGEERVLVLCEPGQRQRLRTLLGAAIHRCAGVRLRDVTEELDALAIVGSRAGRLLGALGVLGPEADLRRSAPFTHARVAGAPVDVLLQSDSRALILTVRADAARVWHAVEEAGRPLHLSHVGSDAVARYALLDARRGLLAA